MSTRIESEVRLSAAAITASSKLKPGLDDPRQAGAIGPGRWTLASGGLIASPGLDRSCIQRQRHRNVGRIAHASAPQPCQAGIDDIDEPAGAARERVSKREKMPSVVKRGMVCMAEPRWPRDKLQGQPTSCSSVHPGQPYAIHGHEERSETAQPGCADADADAKQAGSPSPDTTLRSHAPFLSGRWACRWWW